MKRIQKLFLLISVLLLLCQSGFSQDAKLIIRFMDSETQAVLGKVQVLTSGGTALGISDKDGYVVLPIDVFTINNYLLAVNNGYKVDTLRHASGQHYLTRLAVELGEATISGAQVRRLLDLPSEYVVDYSFNGNTILVATYSGNNGRKAKVLLLDKSGTELGRCAIPDEPISLFNSCVGVHYCVCNERFYPLNIGSSSVSLKAVYPAHLLRGLRQCEQSINGNLYYRITDKHNFKVDYGMIARGDSNFKSFMAFEEREEARASYIELMEIIDLLEHYQFHEAGRKAGLRTMWDKGSFAHINLPLQTSGDTLVVFDYFKKQILLFDTSGAPAGIVPATFDWNHAQLFNIIKDEKTDKLYLHRYGSKTNQTITELDIHTGRETGMRYIIAKPFANKVKVHDGKIYFLWQDGKTASTQQLYTQQMN